MKAPDLSELIKESHPKDNNKNLNNIKELEAYIIELKKNLYELEQENAFFKEENMNIKKEISILKEKIIKDEFNYKSNITLLKTQLNNLKEEYEKVNKAFQEMKTVNQKLCADNKTLMTELDKNMTDFSKLTIQENNKNVWGNELKKLLENKEKLTSELKLNLVISEDKIQKLFDDNKQLNEMNKLLNQKIEEMKEENLNLNNQINEINLNLKSLKEQLNIKNNNINSLEKELENLNFQLKECNNDNNNLNNLNLSLKNENKEIIDNLNNNKKNILLLEQKNKLLLDDLAKKERQINNIQEIGRKQEKEIINLMDKNNIMISNNRDVLILMKEIKNKNDFIYDEYVNLKQKMNSIKDLFQIDDNLEKMLIEFKNNINEENNFLNIDQINQFKEINNLQFQDEKKYNSNSALNMNKSNKIYREFENQNINNNIIDYELNNNNNKNYIYDYSNNKDELTMDKKYEFLFQNKNK